MFVFGGIWMSSIIWAVTVLVLLHRHGWKSTSQRTTRIVIIVIWISSWKLRLLHGLSKFHSNVTWKSIVGTRGLLSSKRKHWMLSKETFTFLKVFLITFFIYRILLSFTFSHASPWINSSPLSSRKKMFPKITSLIITYYYYCTKFH